MVNVNVNVNVTVGVYRSGLEEKLRVDWRHT